MADGDGPVRTCIGCRGRGERGALVRFVLERGDGAALRVVRDDARARPGRGAWLHDDPRCHELARRRGAMRRALRIPGGVEFHVADNERDGAGHVSSPD